ncbi:MarR family winged helix-turn-helix transcriptional regulator [Streptosporangium algeriense]|uniref:MarR family winged helix-turn-helix transcriptional regulator n=1 Tax=Streptosporangium algeriense TaxID=1682748 RepID=A0ABW3DPZ6_9ACTN
MEPRHMRLVLGGGSLVSQVGRDLRAATEAQLTPFDVTTQQAAVLLHAARHESSPNQLAAQLGTDTAGMTRLLDRLEAKGLILRSPRLGDRRSVVIELTGEGRELVPRLMPVFGRIAHRLLEGFSEEEVEQLLTLLQRMLGNLGGPAPANQ